LSAKPIIPRQSANQDVDNAVDYYLREAGEKVTLGFIDALQAAYRHIADHSGTGSPRYAHELDLPGLRSWPSKRYPHLVFYMEREGHIDVWRILHGERDIPAWMREPGSD